MSTDPFEYVLKPVAGEYQEISQTTFVELISAKRNLAKPAFRTSSPSVEDSLRRVAFGKTCHGTTHDPFVGRFTAVPPRVALNSYTIKNRPAAEAAQEIEIARKSTELRSLIANVDNNPLIDANISLQASPGNISGFVWHDVNGNGVWDDGEPALSGWYVYVDTDNSCTIALGEHAAISAANGRYQVQDVSADPVLINGVLYSPPWKLRLVMPPGPNGQTWHVSYPSIGHHLINVVPGGTLNNINFGVTLADPTFPQCPGVCPVDLAIVLDDTISMGAAISNIKNGIRGVLDILRNAIGLDFRLSLVTFKDAINPRYTFVDKCGDMACGQQAIDNLVTALNSVTASGGAGAPEWSAAALKYVVEGNVGGWRSGAVKVALLVTDAINNTESGVTAQQAANAALAAGVQVMYAATPAKNPDMVNEGRIYADTTDGIFVQTDSNGSNLPELLTSFLYGLCAGVVPLRECEGGIDEIINGKFETGVNSWVEHTAPVTWDSSKQAMFVGVGGEAWQTITDLTPGDRLVISANIETASPGSISYGTTFSSQTTDITAGETTRVTHAVDVPDNGEATVRFRSNWFTGVPPTSGASFYIDDVVACVYRVDECGPGTSNTVRNANFADNVRHWTDASGASLPETSPRVWDSIVQAIIVNIAEYEEVRTAINLIPAQSYLLIFDVISSQPDTIPEVSIKYGILNSSGVVVAEGEKSNAAMGTLPFTVALPFSAPGDSIASIFIKSGGIGGVAKIKNVLVCDPTGLCPAGSSRLSYDDFSTGPDGWSGLWEDQSIKLYSVPGGIVSVGKQFAGLTPGSTVEMSLNLKSESYADFELVSGDRINQVVIGPALGRYSNQIVVQSTGTVNAFMKISAANLTGSPFGRQIEVVFDDVLTCVSSPIPCEDNVGSCRAFIKWNGVPRRPFNIFNSIIRYTIRNQTTLETTNYTYTAINEQHSSASTCDFWRQCGDNGSPRSDVLQSGLNVNTIGSINNGDLVDVNGRSNWLWSIPLNISSTSDELIVYYPPPPVGELVEKVTIFFLDQYCQPSGPLTTPVVPPPVLCGPDPAETVEFGVRYINNFGESREFTVPQSINQLWRQRTNFQQFTQTWDHIAAIGDGYKGPIARWNAFEFLLDSVDGSGLDQCTLPIESAQASSAARMSLKKFAMTGKAFFLDEYVLPVVDPGPYEYPLPVGDASVICQSQLPLSRPGPDDGTPLPDGPCCDYDNISDGADFADYWCFERDLFDPYQSGCCGPLTARDLAVKKSLDPDLYNPYVVDWDRGILVDTTYTQIIKGRQTIVLVEKEVDTDDGRSYIMSRLHNHGLQIDVFTNLT